MKLLRYKYKVKAQAKDEHGNPVEKEFLRTKVIKDDEKGRAIAASEAVGEIIEYEDGRIDPKDKPTQLDIIEAQVTYTAMMTDTLLEV